MGGRNANGDVASEMLMIFRKMRKYMVTWTVHNNMEEAERDTYVGVIESYIQGPW